MTASIKLVDGLKPHEDFKQEAIASWKSYRERGKHLTGEEVRNWLRTWGTKAEKALPDCHT